jgi:hypothetical protein
MRFLGRQVVFAGATILGLLACSASNSESDGFLGGGGAATGFAGSTCTQDAGVLTPIGPQGCGANQTVVYRKPLAGSGASAITSAGGTANTPMPAMVTACTDTKCAPGQVAVVTYQASGSSAPLSTGGGGSDDAATASGDGAAPVVDGGAALAPDGAGSVADGGAVPTPMDAAPLPDGEAPDASALATADASPGTTASAGDAGVIGIPCGAVVTCIDTPPTCPAGQSPSYTPSGKWHCMPLCDQNDSNTVVITYGSTYGNTTTCAPAPPTNACPTQGQVWTWDYANEEWVCAPECDNGQYDQHVYGGQTVCVPC